MSLEARSDPRNKIYSSDKSPLLHANSSPDILFNRNSGKKEYAIKHSNTLDDTRLPHLPSSNDSKAEKTVVNYSNKMFTCEPIQYTFPQDIAAMSVASLYQSAENMDSEMNTDSDFMEKKRSDEQTMEINEIPTECNCVTPNPIEANESPIRKQSSQGCNAVKCAKPKIFFRDGVRSVDFMLVWDAFDQESITPDTYAKRQIFETNLLREGLQLEYEPQEQNGLNFVKIHAPKEVLRRYSEILKLRMPMKEVWNNHELCIRPKEYQHSNMFTNISQKIPALRQVSTQTNFLIDGINNQWDKIKSWIFVDKKRFPDKGHRFTAIYSRDREYLFDVDSPCFFTPAIHSRIVQFILDRKRYSNNPQSAFSFGIERLIDEKAYVAAYPLHDGDLRTTGSTRNLLYTEWASIPKWYRYQPLDYIKEYFGVKIALYFAWLGYYTHILLPAAVVGLACFIYSCSTLYNNQPSEDICNQRLEDYRVCPLCDVWCKYWEIRESCVYARISLFDNATTVFFAIFMSVWATLFLEMWKRYSAEITHRWDLTGFDVKEEHPRPQYLARLAHVKRKQVNIVTNTMEPHVPFWKLRVPMTILSFSVVLLLVTLALATVVGVVLYRMSVLVSLKAVKISTIEVDYSTVTIFTTCTAACINLIFILIFNYIYTCIAEYLTEFELLRTQTEFDDSLTLKIYLLQFVNYYASIFYIAFFKGKFVGRPNNYNKIFGFRQEECGPGGCLTELCIQLGIIMVGKQAMNTVLEMLFPLFFKWLNTLKLKTGLTKEKLSCKGCQPQWLKDFKLVEWGPRSLFPVFGNGLYFEFIPKLIYISQHHNLDNYLNSTLSYFNTSDFNPKSRPPDWNPEEVDVCRYPDYREPPGSPNKYEKTSLYWQILAARLAFVVIFENIVVLIMIIVKWAIPDVPSELRDKIRRETYITNEIIIREEAIRAQTGQLPLSPKKTEKLRNINEAPATPEQWDRIISKSLSDSEFELLIDKKVNSDSGPSGQKSPSSA
ncbi:hypothetical protein NQ318_001437 [Aromia moschata]|uniref:Anoctamin n=1 Tax=Aromia moschata TaxID=1265417 RepID=A0AAV8YVL7_9CUCU|nr:hypothetical protein NQ318_001437 [Aromia moschata]